jgi:seryl-tRNA synthetase
MKLFEIDEALQECFDAETGEITDITRFEDLQLEREQKLENIACWIKNLEADAEALKAQKMAFAERQKETENKAERLRNYLQYALQNTNFKTVNVEVKFRKTQKVEVPDVYKLDENFLKYSEPTADKTAIKEAIQGGQAVEGATLIENISMSIK